MAFSLESRHSHATVLAVCISETRGVQKTPVDEIAVALEHGVEGDAHAGDWHRQVSLLADESAEIMRAKGVPVGPGGFGENIVTRGIEVKELPLGTRVRVGETAVLEVTQLGKTCHTPCAIGRLAGECIMPVEGVFCRVLNAGKIRAGDRIDVVARPAGDPAEPAARGGSDQAGLGNSSPAAFHTAVLVLSDSRSDGRREELVIPACREVLQGTAFEITETQVLPDEEAQIADTLRALVARGDIALILTSGGTGLAPRDRTPEATRAVIEREAPGFAELLRLKGLEKTPMAVLTRGIAGTAGHCLIINLPGSPKAVREGLEVLLPILPHALETLLGRASECASLRNTRGDRRTEPQ
ncbi:MAG: MOSC domain-containing protein [Candidatus Eisenbacteria sp.]|nr:MOSC domain-containing protein [Candidatus Eisenbacteria bacterium]